jgi:cell division septum initiation protein DivIVA
MNVKGIDRILVTIATIFALSVVLGMSSSCEGWFGSADPGPAEKAGRRLDQAANQANKNLSEAAHEVGDKIQQDTQSANQVIGEATEEVGRRVEEAGEHMQDSGPQEIPE